MPDQTQQILQDLTKVSMDIYLHAKKEHYTSNSFGDIKVSAIWFMLSNLAYNLRSRFFPDIQFSHSQDGASFKAKK